MLASRNAGEDLLLGSFADTCLAGFDNTQLERFEALLDCSDPDLFEWILGGAQRAYPGRSSGGAGGTKLCQPPGETGAS
jgi:hypothetical protein